MSANQSRRVSDIDAPLLGKSTVEFQYQPLDPLVDCTRLVEFEPAEDANDTPRCKLIHVTFGEKPKYVALSYMWGDEILKKNIFIHGKEFLVGQNLWEALHYLRKRVNGLRYWIDAICINQANIPERNRQLRIMPHIYMRAHIVLVWLGRKYAKYDANDWQTSFHANQLFVYTEKMAEKKLLQAGMVKELCSDEYWNRVWIVQEIGKARKIQVCFGEVEVAWDAFIYRIKFIFHIGKGGPLNLERQLQEKYRGENTFRRLLENHQNAVCKDPRDKIYGFVGLATDARGFHMDYQKSLLEVWKDTMLFANRHGMLPESDIICFGRMVKRLLGGSSVATIDQVAQEYASWTDLPLSIYDVRDPIIFNLPAYIAGMIICIGPSPKQILSVLDAEDEWGARIQQNFPADLGNAHRDNDFLMQVLLDTKTNDLDVLSFPNPCIRWKSHATLRLIIDNYKTKSNKHEEQRTKELSVAQQTKAHGLENTKPMVPTSVSCLYQIERITRQNSPWKMGIAAGEAQTGDLICWIREVETAVIVRIDNDWLQIIGTAIIPENLCGQGMTEDHTEYFGSDEEFELRVDVETAYVLVSWGQDRGMARDDDDIFDEILNDKET